MKMAMMLFALSLADFGCASQKSADDLDARLTKLESKRTEDRAAMESALDSAETERLHCRAAAEGGFSSWLKMNGTPKKGQEGVYTASQEGIRQAHDQQDKEIADCQRAYEDAVQAAKLRYSE